jgi:predicted RNA-binding protein with PIN domain
MKYIIDGYNLTHQIDNLRDKSLRQQRDGLILFLQNAQSFNKRLKDVTVIFDGRSDIVAPIQHSTIKVVFSKDRSADIKIKELIEASNFARDITVVSDDRQIKYYASSAGAKKISVREFLKIVSCSLYPRIDYFELSEKETKKINQELEEIWLKGRASER